MELKYSKILDKKTKTMSMFIYDLLGVRNEETGRYFDGHEFAKEMRYVDEYYDEIELHLNLDGGMVAHGLSIISAMIDISAKVITINDGVCASMGSLILLNGDVVKVKDFSKTMLHEAYLVNEKGEVVTKPSAKQKEGINMANDTLRRLLKRRGKTDEEATSIITKKDNWMTPEALLEAGLIDEIITTERKVELIDLEPLKLVALIQKENLPNNKNMDKVIAKLNGLGIAIAANATEDQVVAVLDTLDLGGAKPNQKLIDQLVGVGKKSGVITEGESGNEAKFRQLADANMDLFVDLIGIDKLGAVPASGGVKQARMSDAIANARKGMGGNAADEKTFAWYEENDPQALAKMEQVEPEKFAKLEAADKAKYQ
jgi:ATP-dependent protease ClpP protease subunit